MAWELRGPRQRWGAGQTSGFLFYGSWLKPPLNRMDPGLKQREKGVLRLECSENRSLPVRGSGETGQAQGITAGAKNASGPHVLGGPRSVTGAHLGSPPQSNPLIFLPERGARNRAADDRRGSWEAPGAPGESPVPWTGPLALLPGTVDTVCTRGPGPALRRPRGSSDPRGQQSTHSPSQL